MTHVTHSSRQLALGAALLLAGGAAQAATIADIAFDEVPVGTPDPSIESFQFSAGDPLNFSDTYTDDSLPPDPYLVSGYDDFGIVGDATYTLILATYTAGSIGGAGLDTTISLDASFITGLLPGNPSTLRMEVRSGTTVLGSDSLTCTLGDAGNPFCQNYSSLDIVLNGLGFDNILFYDPSAFGAIFRIDNLLVETRPQGPGPVPEPSSLLLLAVGALSLPLIRRQPKSFM
jgi:hypothetical protein